MKQIVLIIAPQNFRDEEYFETKDELEKAGCNITTASSEKEARSMVAKRKISVDCLLEDVAKQWNKYDALVFIGGSGAVCYFQDKTALKLAQQFAQMKTLAAICIAPSILANAGVLKGKRATSWPSEQKNIEEKGALFQEQPVVQDGNIITADGPQSARLFGKVIAAALR